MERPYHTVDKTTKDFLVAFIAAVALRPTYMQSAENLLIKLCALNFDL